MTEQKPNAGDPTSSSDGPSTQPEAEGLESTEPSADASDAPEANEVSEASEASADEPMAEEPDAEADAADEPEEGAEGADAEDAELAPDGIGEAAALTAAAAGAAWTTTPVAPDPEATEAALAALAAKPEVTIEPAEPPLDPSDLEPVEEGTPILLVGGILVGAFIVALAIVLLLFRPFDSSEVVPSLSPSPILTEAPSESPSAVAIVDTPNFQGLSLEDAEQTAEDYGLILRAIPVETDEVDAGIVIGQDPPPGESIEEGSTVELEVAVAVSLVPVPDITELPEAEALEALEEADLVAGERSEATSEDIAAGAVISQDPAAASELPPGSAVDYVVSTGQALVPVPDITELPEAEALEALEEADLVAGERSEATSEDIAAGAVISQDPAAASELPPGSAVDYVVSTGQALVPVPDITELPEAEALEALEEADLVAGERSEATSEDIAAGAVISQDPAAASELPPGSAVDYVVSTGQALVPVPDITELPEAEALEALEEADLVAGERSEATSEDIAAGAVISQDPAAASELPPGSAVDYVVSTGQALVPVPDITELPEAEALEALEEADLVAGERSEATSEDIAAGAVISQDPAAASELPPGSAVDYVVSTGQALVPVPDITELPEAEALEALEEADLVAGERSEATSEDIAAGAVISQDPAAASELPPGSAVDYVVSTGQALVENPSFVGMSLEDAQAQAASVGVELATEEQESVESDPGTVLDQAPAAGTPVEVGSLVTLTVAIAPELVPVPDLSGPAADAPATLEEARLVAGAETEAYHDAVPEGDVISQDPAAGSTVPPGTAVAWVTSLGVELVPVPDLSGPAADAPATLEEARLVAGAETEAYHDAVPEGDVISQDPAAGSTVPPGTAVAWVTSLGVELVPVPDLSGPAADAPATLEEARLVAGAETEAYHDAVPEGDVISQDPAAGSTVPPGTAVAWVTSLGVELVPVPDLSGPAADAPATLEEARLVAGAETEAYHDAVPEGDVISQDPAAGSTVPPGTAVAWVTSLGVELVPVPDLSGPAADAPATLEEARLVAGAETEAYHDAVPEGDVISQDPAAGSTVPPGTAVAWVTSLGVELVPVPDLSGPAADAPATLEEARLVAGAETEAYHDAVPEGDVISQDPAAGSTVPPGTAVAWVTSLGVELVPVPDLSGPAADAPATLEEARLVAGAETEAYHDAVPEGDVISQDPAAGSTVPPGTAVAWVTSLGVELVPVPDLSGPAADAPATLEEARLVAGAETEAYHDAVPEGDVISQDPAAGSTVPPGTAVAWVTSLGVELVPVPDLSGPAADAPATLEEARLVAGAETEAYHDAVPEGDVISQDPAAGSTVPPGTAVAWVTSLGVELVPVPDLSGPAADAPATLEEARLVAGAETEAYHDAVPEGDVISQDPAAGSTVPPGTAVAWVTSLGVTPDVAIPNVRNQPEADAVATLEAAGLIVGDTVIRGHDSVAAGDAIRTEPSDETEIPLGSSVTLFVSSGPTTVTIPEVRGTPAAEAEASLTALDLVVTTEERTNANVPAGEAVKTEPAAGTEVEAGADVLLTISRGPKPAVVPDVVGSMRNAARTSLTEAGLTSDETVVDDDAPRNTVLAQDPAAGTEVPTGSAVAITLSAGPPLVTIPEVRGTPAAEAEASLTALDLVVTTEERTNANVPAGEAVKTEPAAGTEVEAGADVLLTISRGPKPAVVPDVVGSMRNAARTSLTEAGLTSDETVVDDDAPRNTVLAQDPAAGTEVPTGSAVAITLSAGPPLVTIPEVRGTPAAEAEASLTALDLVVTTEERTNANVPAGEAVKTEPAAGTEVEAGADVLLTISRGPKPAVVPDVVGSMRNAARTSLTEAGLTSDETVVDDDAPRNTVLAQDPAAGTEVPTGSAVAITLSAGPPLVTIPEVRGTPAAEAEASLTALDLVVTTEERTNANVPAGEAVKTEPAAGTEVEAGADVLLTISRGPKPAVVPDVVGSMRNAARTSLTEAGLTSDETVVDDDAPRNTVLAQDPAAGTEVPTGSAVAITLSAGPPLVTIPEVRGTPAAEAEASLTALDLVVTTEERTNANVPAGEAVKTEPAAGTEVEAGADVLLTISRGPKPAVVPDVVGSMRNAARTSLTEAGLTSDETVVDDDAPRNTVLAQDPAAGTEVPTGSAVAITLSAGPPLVTIPEVRGTPAAEAEASLTALDLVVTTEERTNANVPAGEAVKTEPAAGTEVEAGADVLLTISRGPKPAVVPDVVGSQESAAITSIESAGLVVGQRGEAIDEAAPGTVISQDPAADTEVATGASVDYVVSLGPPVAPRGEGGSLDNETVVNQLDVVAATIPDLRQLELGNTPYDGVNRAGQEDLMAERSAILYDPSTIADEEAALKRMGLLGANDDLSGLLDTLYGQGLPINYLEQRGRQSILQSIDQFNVPQRAQAAREFGRAAVLDAFGSDAARVSDSSEGDRALAALALELGDGTTTMLDWSRANVGSGNQGAVEGVIVPGNDDVFASMPQLLQREYSFPFLEGRAFVGQLRQNGGWESVNSAWGRLPESTEQVMHPNRYGSDRPTSIDMDAVTGQLGGGWSESWQQTMGELRIGVWLADGQPGTQDGPRAPVKLPKANAAAGWGGDRLVSLDGPDGSWAIVWQTKWDSADDIGQFVNAANAAIADLPGAHAILRTDVSTGVSNPVLVLLVSDQDALASVADALGVAGQLPTE